MLAIAVSMIQPVAIKINLIARLNGLAIDLFDLPILTLEQSNRRGLVLC